MSISTEAPSAVPSARAAASTPEVSRAENLCTTALINESPAPMVSATATRRPGTVARSPAVARTAPDAPSVTIASVAPIASRRSATPSGVSSPNNQSASSSLTLTTVARAPRRSTTARDSVFEPMIEGRMFGSKVMIAPRAAAS